MTIKEMEMCSGMTRANIRYYESEGLISPRRNENGYREYSEKDYQVLMRIKLLRSLRVSLEEIKALHRKEEEMDVLLGKHMSKLEAERVSIDISQSVCQKMKEDRVQYETLDAEKYIQIMKTRASDYGYDTEIDKEPRVYAPKRRYVARIFDLYLYETILKTVLILVWKMNITEIGTLARLLITAVSIVLMILIEPLLLSKFGTTPGKVILGLKVLDYDKQKLNYADAKERTILAMWYGMGMGLPIYSWIRMWKSYRVQQNDEELEWERNGEIYVSDDRFWRITVCIVTYILVFMLPILSTLMILVPKHRGNITIAQFSENYNQYASYYGFYSRLDEEGRWKEEYEEDGFIFDISTLENVPNFTYVEENGILKEVQLEIDSKNEMEIVGGFQKEQMLAISAFARAQGGYHIYSTETEKILRKIEENPFLDYNYDLYGVNILADINYYGYNGLRMDTSDPLYVTQGTNEYGYYLKFTMKK